ncbi:MAG: hypothetical protein ACKVZ6_21705 [Kineosporiaceae bacterium]
MPQAATEVPGVVLVVDVANVMGSRPDGWWRDRAGAAARLVAGLGPLVGRMLPIGPDGEPLHVVRAVAVLEGQARRAELPAQLLAAVDVVLAAADGDTAVVEQAAAVLATGGTPLVVTADRGLRDRLPAGCLLGGPGRLRDLL